MQPTSRRVYRQFKRKLVFLGFQTITNQIKFFSDHNSQVFLV